jgi:hypothetical protein
MNMQKITTLSLIWRQLLGMAIATVLSSAPALAARN